MAHGLIHSTRVLDLSLGTAAQVTITVEPSPSVANGVAFPQQPVIQVRDASNNAIARAGVLVTAALFSGPSTLGGALTFSTDTSGVATFTNLTLTGSPGDINTIIFTSPGLASIQSTQITTIGGLVASKLAIASQPPSSAPIGVVLTPSIQVEDVSGTTVPQSGIHVTVAKASGPSSLSGTLVATTNSSGLAQFTDLLLTGAVGDVDTLAFTSPSLTGVTSNAITTVNVSDLNAPSYVAYVPRPHPPEVLADAAANGFTLAALPQNFLYTKYGYDIDGTALGSFHTDNSCVVAGNISLATNTTNFQAALTAANSRSQNTKIVLPCPFPMAGVIFTKTTSGNFWIYVEASSLPCAEGVRATPAMFDITNPPTIEFNSDSGGFASIFSDGAHRIRLIGIKWRTNDAFLSGGIFLDMNPYPANLSNPGAWDWNTQRTDRLCVDRCWFRGGDRAVGNVAYQPISNGVYLACTNQAVVDSTIDGIAEGGINNPQGNETHGILVEWCETFKIDNNYVESSSIGVFLGGLNGGAIGNGHRPTDGVIRHNFMSRPLAWITTSPSWDGGSGRPIKNGTELKGGERILYEGNIVTRNTVQGGQFGQAFGVKVATSGSTSDLNGNGISLVKTTDVTIRWNDVAESQQMLAMQGVNDYPWFPNPIPPGFIDATCVNKLSFYSNRGTIGPWGGTNLLPPYTFSHVHHHVYYGWNTTVPTGDGDGFVSLINLLYTGLSAYESPNGLTRADHLNILNNISAFEYVNEDGSNTQFPSGAGDAGLSIHTAGSYHWSGNCVINPQQAIFGNPEDGNALTPNGTPGQTTTLAGAQFVDAAGRNYRITSNTSPFYRKAAGSVTGGCDNDTVDLATSGVGTI